MRYRNFIGSYDLIIFGVKMLVVVNPAIAMFMLGAVFCDRLWLAGFLVCSYIAALIAFRSITATSEELNRLQHVGGKVDVHIDPKFLHDEDGPKAGQG